MSKLKNEIERETVEKKEREKEVNKWTRESWKVKPEGLLFKTRTIESTCVSLHKQRNHILFLISPTPLPKSSWGCVYLNVCLNGECYCSNQGWHHSTFPLSSSLPPFPPRHAAFFCRSDPAHTRPTHTHTNTCAHTHACTLHDCAMPEINLWITGAQSAVSLLREEESGKRRKGQK